LVDASSWQWIVGLSGDIFPSQDIESFKGFINKCIENEMKKHFN